MTLIFNCLTQDFVLQVSDRRLTFQDGSLAEDDANKAVLYCGHFLIGYTGLAELGTPSDPMGRKTDWWIAQELAPADLGAKDAFARLAAAAGPAVHRLGVIGDYRRTSIGAVGWVRVAKDDRPLVPALTVISNFQDVNGNLSPVSDAFSVSSVALAPGQPFLWSWLGQSLSNQWAVLMNRRVKRAVRKGKVSAVTAVFVQAIREVARTNRRVGKNLMVALLPRAAVPAGSAVVPFSGQLSSTEMSCAYLPEKKGPVMYAPNLVCGGMIAAGIETWTERPPWWKDLPSK